MASVNIFCLFFLTLFVFYTHVLTQTIDYAPAGCGHAAALGMESGDIEDKDIQASSFYSEGLKPQNGRIRLDLGEGGWCPAGMVADDTYEFLEIQFPEVMIITAVETQGKFNDTVFSRQYKLDYLPKVEPKGQWQTYKDKSGNEKIKGNINADDPVKRKLEAPVTAQRIRFVPFSETPVYVCMRVELYGCSHEVTTPSDHTEISTQTEMSTEASTNHDVTTQSELSTEHSTATAEQTTSSTSFITDITPDGSTTYNPPAGGSTGFHYYPDLVYIFVAIFLAFILVVAVLFVRRKRLRSTARLELENCPENSALIT